MALGNKRYSSTHGIGCRKLSLLCCQVHSSVRVHRGIGVNPDVSQLQLSLHPAGCSTRTSSMCPNNVKEV